jgi:hypothetical protein
MLDVHPPHAPTHTWKDFLLHIATIVIGLLIAIGLEQTVELLHHHHQREQLEQDLRAESVNNVRYINHDLELQKLEPWFDHAASSLTAPGSGLVHVTLTPLPCIPGTASDGSFRTILPFEGVWLTARENGVAGLVPAERARIYFRRSVLFVIMKRYDDLIYDNCLPLNAMQRRLAKRSTDGSSYEWTLTPGQAEKFATLASEQASALKALCFRLRYLRDFEQDLLDGGHRVNGAPLDANLNDVLDPEDQPQPR